MAKKVIQVPMDNELLAELDRLSSDRHVSRAELIRESCEEYLRGTKVAERESAYLKGYLKHPESGEVGEMQLSVLGEVLKDEEW
jgi:metal-responsive CopG/Arc/MetJ family transcriptional regulator